MVVAESSAGVPPADRSRLEFVYDPPSHSFGVAGPQGRRRFKKLYTWDEAGQTWVLSETHTYLYDGWNVICEQVTPAGGQTSNRYYVWGLDIAEMQGAGLPAHSSPGATAGGVGGLLAAYTPDGNWFYAYDGQPRAQRARDGGTDPAIAGERAQRPKEAATSGNVTTLVSTTDGAVSAPPRLTALAVLSFRSRSFGDSLRTDYSPFGLTVSETGPAADANIYRFSTKPLDEPASPEGNSLGEGLYYYGFRYYNPTLGRWMSRDRLRTSNLYSAIENDSINSMDLLGLSTRRCGWQMCIEPPCSIGECLTINFLLSTGSYLTGSMDNMLWTHWYMGSGTDLVLDYSQFDTNGTLDDIIQMRKNVAKTIGSGLKCSQTKYIGFNKTFTPTKPSSNNMINEYSLSLRYSCTYMKICNPDCTCSKIVVDCLFNAQANDKIDFNPGGNFNAGPFRIYDDAVNYCFKAGYPGGLGLGKGKDFAISGSRHVYKHWEVKCK